VEEIHPRLTAIVLFSLEFGSFFICLLLGLIYNDTISNSGLNNGAVILVGTMIGFSMGVHNGAAKESISNCPSTTVMTMTIVTTSGHASNTLNYWMAKYSLLTMQPRAQAAVESKIEEKFKESRSKLLTSGKPLVTFLLGALVGAAAMTNMGFWCMLLPMGVVLVKIIDITAGYFLENEGSTDANNKISGNAVVNPVVHSPVIMASSNRGVSSSPTSPTGRLSYVSHEVAVEAGELVNVAGDNTL
jgi:uncharacterized membrane protein